jgi:hypothetical protein
MASQIDRQYINLLVFSVVAGLISIVVMVATVAAAGTDIVRRLAPAIITVEVGLLLIVAHAIYQSVKRVSRLRESEQQQMRARLDVTTCPDYWTLASQDQDGHRVCTNTFRDALNPRVHYVISGTHPDPEAVRNVHLSEYDDATVREACDKASKEVMAPWHAIDAMCQI